MPEKLKLLKPRIDATLALDTANKDTRTVEMQFYSGAEVRRYSFGRGEYFLRMSMEPSHVRLGRLNSGRAPILESHADRSTRDVLGVIEKGWLENGRGMARARFAKEDPEADRVWNKIEQKILNNVSMGVVIHKVQETSKEDDDTKSFLAVDWEPQEISVVPIGADPGACVMGADQSDEIEVEVEFLRATRPKEASLMPDEKTTGDEARKDEQATVSVADEQLNKARSVGVTAEQGRITGILQVAKVCGLNISFAEKHIKDNTSLDSFRAIAIDEQAKAASKQEVRHVHADILHDESDTRRSNLTGALLERFLPGMWSIGPEGWQYHKEGGQKLHDGARNYRSCTLLDVAKECLAVQNINWRNKSRTEIAQLAFMGTSDFPYILEDVAGKSLRAGYEAVESQWRQIAARRSAADFKTQKELVLDSNARLLEVKESGEFTRGKLVEGKETWGLKTYGRVIAITRQAIINDNLGAFTRTPQLMGQEVAMLEADTVWGIVTTNGNLADAVALFAAAATRGATVAGNLVTGAGTAISIDSIGVMRAMMMRQTSPGGQILGVTPKFLVAPATKAQIAEQYTSAAYQAATSATINPMAGRLTPIIEPRLDANGTTTAWYLFADPNTPNGTVLIYAYLEGQEGPYTETRNGFDVDGVEIKIRHDFGAAAIDFRGAVKNDGA